MSASCLAAIMDQRFVAPLSRCTLAASITSGAYSTGSNVSVTDFFLGSVQSKCPQVVLQRIKGELEVLCCINLLKIRVFGNLPRDWRTTRGYVFLINGVVKASGTHRCNYHSCWKCAIEVNLDFASETKKKERCVTCMRA